MAAAPPLFIPAEKVRELVTMRDLIEVLGPALQWFSASETEGGVVQPLRSVVDVKDHNGCLLVMSAFSRLSNGLGTKLVTLYPGNADKSIPSHNAIVLVFNPATGILQGLVDGNVITDMRTAAASACAIKALVPKPPSVLCIVGTGGQARSHAEAFRVCHSFTEIRVWGRSHANAEKCVRDIGGNAVVYDSLPEAVKDADVIATVTLATEPVVFGKLLKPGAVICSVGACRPDWRELDDVLMHDAVVVADSREAAEKEAGDIILSGVEVFAEIGEVLAGKKTLPRVPDCRKKFIVFKSLGLAVEDVVSAKLVYDRCVEQQKSQT